MFVSLVLLLHNGRDGLVSHTSLPIKLLLCLAPSHMAATVGPIYCHYTQTPALATLTTLIYVLSYVCVRAQKPPKDKRYMLASNAREKHQKKLET